MSRIDRLEQRIEALEANQADIKFISANNRALTKQELGQAVLDKLIERHYRLREQNFKPTAFTVTELDHQYIEAWWDEQSRYMKVGVKAAQEMQLVGLPLTIGARTGVVC